jgi:hypothetical protein
MMESGYLFYRQNIAEAFDEKMAVAFEGLPIEDQERLVYAAREVLKGQNRKFEKNGIVIPKKEGGFNYDSQRNC